jgi:hypothetical protein
MDKIAAYEMLLSEHPLWEDHYYHYKEAGITKKMVVEALGVPEARRVLSSVRTGATMPVQTTGISSVRERLQNVGALAGPDLVELSKKPVVEGAIEAFFPPGLTLKMLRGEG